MSMQDNPLDNPLPCDIKVGQVTIKKGCKLKTLILRMNVLYGLAMNNQDAKNNENCDLKEKVKQLEHELAEARKVIEVVDGLVTAKGRYHTAQWYQKMVNALDEYKENEK